MSKTRLVIFVALVAFSGVTHASLVTMDFESLAVTSDEQVIVHGTTYSEDGFVLSTTCCEPFGPVQETDLRSSGTLAAIFPGSTAMRGGKSETLIELTRADGGRFNLLSIDLATLPNTELVDGVLVPIDAGVATEVTFEGVRATGLTVSQTFSHTDFLSLTRYIFQGFSNLLSVTWRQGSGDPNASHQFDNLRIVEVPEPGSLALLVGGLVGLGLLRRSKLAS